MDQAAVVSVAVVGCIIDQAAQRQVSIAASEWSAKVEVLGQAMDNASQQVKLMFHEFDAVHRVPLEPTQPGLNLVAVPT